jgi:hypothetical protein
VKIGLEGKISRIRSIMRACRAKGSVGSARNGLKGQHAHLIGTREIPIHHPVHEICQYGRCTLPRGIFERKDRQTRRCARQRQRQTAAPTQTRPVRRGEERPHEARCCRSGFHWRPVTSNGSSGSWAALATESAVRPVYPRYLTAHCTARSRQDWAKNGRRRKRPTDSPGCQPFRDQPDRACWSPLVRPASQEAAQLFRSHPRRSAVQSRTG